MEQSPTEASQPEGSLPHAQETATRPYPEP